VPKITILVQSKNSLDRVSGSNIPKVTSMDLRWTLSRSILIQTSFRTPWTTYKPNFDSKDRFRAFANILEGGSVIYHRTQALKAGYCSGPCRLTNLGSSPNAWIWRNDNKYCTGRKGEIHSSRRGSYVVVTHAVNSTRWTYHKVAKTPLPQSNCLGPKKKTILYPFKRLAF